MRTLSLIALAAVAGAAFAQYTPGNLVVRIVGDGGATTGAQPTRLREYTTGGAQVGSDRSLNGLPGPRDYCHTYGETSEGSLHISEDGRFLLFSGYDIAPRDAGFDVFVTPRSVGKLEIATGNITNAPTFIPDLGDGLRGLASVDGTSYAVTGGDVGIYEGLFTGLPTNPVPGTNSSRNATYRGSLLWFNGSNVFSGGNGMVTWNGTSLTPVFATPNGASGREFEFLDDDTIYYATSTGAQGLMKMVRNPFTDTWSLAYQIGGIGVNGVAVGPMTANGREIYVTGSAGADLFRTYDTGSSFTPLVSIATAGTNQRFRGLVLIPGAAPEVVVPSSITTIRGRLDSGNVASLGSDDNSYLRHCKFIVPNTLVPPIEVQVNGTTTKASTTGVTAQLTGKMANAGSFSHTVEQRNQVTLAYEDGATAAVNTTESTITSNSTGNHNEKIGSGGALQAKYFIRRTGPSAVAAFCYDAEWFRWTVN